MGLEPDESDNNTILSAEEREGLRIPAIVNRQQLDEYEQLNIEETIQWLNHKTFPSNKILSESFIKNLHKRMFSSVWKWAGTFRKSNKNLGIEWYEIPMALKQLLDDASYWIEHQTFEPEEIAIRFKHRLVSIHCFPNGNGRHSRLMADILIEKIMNKPVFTWGGKNITTSSDQRKTYIDALHAADRGEIKSLIEFAKA